jgi:DNA repair exonuclease SbcCD ATPase subunit
MAEDKNRPVTKLINLLKDMQAQLQKEQKEDEEVYEKVACWCETNDKEKTAAIEEAEARITDLTSTIEEMTAQSARLNTEIKNLEAEIAKNQEALAKATAIRQKELAEFNAEEKDMLQSIGALKSAVTVLSKHHSSFAQVPEASLLDIASTVSFQFRKHAALLKGVVTPSQRKAMAAFMQAPGDYFDADPTFKQSYAPQSGQIFGILKQMKETFESNLSASQKEEMQNQAAYEDLKAAKEAEIKAGEDQKDTKTQELADTDQSLAQTKQDLEDTRNSLSADQKFLMNLKETCAMTDSEWEERQKARQEEIQACSEALAILSSDDAHDTFTKTFNFAQVKVSKTGKERRANAANVLLAAARASHNPQLAALAAHVRLDAFTKVKAAIDDMIAALLKEKADEIKHKDFCTQGLNDNARAQELKARDIDDLEAEIETLTSTIDELTKSIATLEAEIAEMQTQLKRAGEDRELENKDFQATVADQRETQKLLNSALNVLKAVYAKKFLLQVQTDKKQEPAGPPPPPGFGTYKKQSSGGVMGMLEQIIADTKTLEAEAIKAESDAQKAYEAFVKDTNASVEEKTRDITNKSDEKAKAEQDKTSAEEAKDAAMNEQQMNKNEEADLHKSCDFTIKNFDIRQSARDQEVEALRQAKAILSGAKFTDLLQKE